VHNARGNQPQPESNNILGELKMDNVEQTLVDREKTHGSYKDVAACSQSLKYVISQGKSELTSAQAESLDMICSKLARILCGDPNEPDHWHDIAGYAKLVERELRRGEAE
jgi:hypothetical protein